jgi:dTDP-4-amino-4,6-dideoxygalactose transaminase
VTDEIADSLVRLPLWIGIEPLLDRILEAADRALHCEPA